MKSWMKILLPVMIVLFVAAPFMGCTSSDDNSEETASITEPTAPAIVEGVFSSSSTDTGFVWKPVSESDGRLVILFPTALRGQVITAGVYANWPPTAENLIEDGRFTGDTTNGNRPHYRFSVRGAAFGQNVYAIAHLGEDVYEWWYIPNGASRWEM